MSFFGPPSPSNMTPVYGYQSPASMSSDLMGGSTGSLSRLNGIPFSGSTPQYEGSIASNLAVPISPLAEDRFQEKKDIKGVASMFQKAKDITSMLSPSMMGSIMQVDTQAIPPNPFTMAPEPVLHNIVATVDLDCKIDLKTIALRARNAEYNPKRFSAVIMRIQDPRCTALLFSSGKMVVTGGKSEEMTRLATRKFARIVQKIDYPQVKLKEFKLQNLVAAVDVHFPIQLEGLAVNHAQFSTYEPELFPGLIYRMIEPRCVLLIFVSGKIVLTGAKSREAVERAFNQIYPVIKGFMKT